MSRNLRMAASGLKRCPKCKHKKDRKTGFHKDSSTPDGLRVYCKVCQRENNSKQYAAHKPARDAANKVYVADNRTKVNTKHTLWRKQVRLEVLYHYSNSTMSCACCGENNIEFLCLDHKNGGGSIWDMPAIDSKRVVSLLVELEPVLGCKLPTSLIKCGGYTSVEELRDTLFPKIRALCSDAGGPGLSTATPPASTNISISQVPA